MSALRSTVGSAVKSTVHSTVCSTLRIQGLEIAMRVQGHGPALLLINGMTRPMQSWEPFTEALTGRRRPAGRGGPTERTVITFDAPGVGESPAALVPLSIARLAALAVAVLDAAGVARADVLGYSHGGAVAQQMALDAPERVHRLILASTSCGVGATPSRGQAILRSLKKPADADPWQLADAVSLVWQSLAISSWSSISFLGGINAPTLVVCGIADSVVAPANSRVLAGRIPGAVLASLRRGHDLQRPGAAQDLARTVGRFLAEGSRQHDPVSSGSSRSR